MFHTLANPNLKTKPRSRLVGEILLSGTQGNPHTVQGTSHHAAGELPEVSF